MQFKLFNTLTRQLEEFKPLKNKKVGIYACGPTVYDYAHIGNLRSYIIWDILRRALEFNGFKVKHVMNITDVGHLTSDADEGEDKIEKGSSRENKPAWEIADFYTKAFMRDMADLNIHKPDIICRATEHIQEQIKLIKKLEKKGFTYITADGVYFDTSKLSDYGKLAELNKQDLRAGIRVALGGKKNNTDFALWKFSPKLSKRQMEWKSPWGVGFPGWHIECSAMSAKYLGIPFDIHTGGIDHIPVHHTNEIAQTEAAEGVMPAKYWIHNEFLNMGEEKMAKSAGNFITLETLKEKNINPIAYRYFILQAHYRKQLIFSWQALEAAQNGLEHLYKAADALERKTSLSMHSVEVNEKIKEKFLTAINNDLDTPAALAIIWEAVKGKKISQKTLFEYDEILGLKIKDNLNKEPDIIPVSVQTLIRERDIARAEKNWQKSDELRDKLTKLGYTVRDTPKETNIKK